MKTFLIILAIILLILLLLWLFRRKKNAEASGKHEKADDSGSNRKVSEDSVTASSVKTAEKADESAARKIKEAAPPAKENAPAEKASETGHSKEYELFFASDEPSAKEESEPEERPAEESPVITKSAPVEEAPVAEEVFAEAEEQPAEAPAAKSFSLNSAVQKDSSLKTLNRFNRVIAINIETPNNEHDSICNIGITVGDTEKCLSTNVTVNPEEAIDDVPDGMTEEEILNSPTLKELWPGMSKLLAGSLVIAHNASYDLTILKKALKAYGLEVPEFYQACTYRMSRKFHPEFDSYKLGSICETYQIPLDVKNAVSHSDACFDIFCRLVDEGNPVFEEAKLFSLD